MAENTRNPQMAQYFWNAYSNIQSQVGPLGGYDYNRELLTYIQADDRYVSYVQDYADMKGITGTARDTMVADAQRTHEESYQTLDTSPGYSTDMQGLANDFYFTIEQSYDNAPGHIEPAQPVQTVETVQADPITSRIDTAFAVTDVAPPADPITSRIDAAFEASDAARVEMPGLDAYAARLRDEITPSIPAADTAPVFTPMGDIAMPAAVTPETVTPVVTETASATPAAAEVATPVMTPMGDVAAPADPVVATPAAVTPEAATPATPAYDSNFTASQLGDLGAAPAAGITEQPQTTPIAAADMPIPQPNVPPAQEEPAQEDQSTSRDYTVARGDNMWKIVQREYGLTKPADIQRTVDYIASVNGMGEGTRANHLSIGQVIQLPDSPTPPADTPRLDWAALDAETSRNLRGQFRPAAEGIVAAAPTPEVTPESFIPESRQPLVVPGLQRT